MPLAGFSSLVPPSVMVDCADVKVNPQSTSDVKEIPPLYLGIENEVYIVDGIESATKEVGHVNICK